MTSGLSLVYFIFIVIRSTSLSHSSLAIPGQTCGEMSIIAKGGWQRQNDDNSRFAMNGGLEIQVGFEAHVYFRADNKPRP